MAIDRMDEQEEMGKAPAKAKKDPEDFMFDGLREDYPDLADFDDDVMFQAVREADFTDMDEKTYKQALMEAYVPEEYRPKNDPVPGLPGIKHSQVAGLGQMMKSVGDVASKLPGQIAEDATKMVTSAPAAIGRALGSVGMEKPREEMESVDYRDLLARGYSPEIAQHVMKQRIATQEDLASKEMQVGVAGQDLAVEGAASYISTGTGLGLEGLAANIAKKGFTNLIKHAASGAFGFGGYEALKAAGEEKSAAEIMNATLEGAALGGVAGPVMAVAGKMLVKPFKMVGSVPRYIEEKNMAKAARLKADLAVQAEDYANKFNADWLRTKYDAWAMLHGGMDPNTIAASLLARVLGNDVAFNASESAVAKIAEKIRIQRRYVALDPSMQTGFRAPLDPIAQMGELMGANPMTGILPAPSPREALDAVIAQGQMQEQIAQQSMLPPIEGGQAPVPNMMEQGGRFPGVVEPGATVGQHQPYGAGLPGLESAPTFTPPGGVAPAEGLSGQFFQQNPPVMQPAQQMVTSNPSLPGVETVPPSKAAPTPTPPSPPEKVTQGELPVEEATKKVPAKTEQQTYTFRRRSDGKEFTVTVDTPEDRPGNGWIQASEEATKALELKTPGLEMDLVAAKVGNEPWKKFDPKKGDAGRESLAKDMNRAGHKKEPLKFDFGRKKSSKKKKG